MRIIAGRWRGRRLKALRGRDVRPTSDRVRESWMAALGADLEGATVLDLFAGSGALGFEALSRGAERVVFVERSRGALKGIRDNAELLGAESEVEICGGDAMEYVRHLEAGAFDLALADPPYGKGFAERLIEAFGVVPFASQLWVEHRKTDATPDPPGLRQRSYGDTLISIVEAKT
ncbi:MAG: 16S rRNA (guanine(966)-N(2))-methyltransferase RsmD [Gemmatimonadetes bacterium]|nr:16S rRNA (guanine(966)-N(2))-methyltransferase RsmD [Gemmatimonadota bacterium]